MANIRQAPEAIVNRFFMTKSMPPSVLFVEGVDDELALGKFLDGNSVKLLPCNSKENVICALDYFKGVNELKGENYKYIGFVDDDHDSILNKRLKRKDLYYSDCNDFLIDTIESRGLKSYAQKSSVTPDILKSKAYSEEVCIKAVFRFFNRKYDLGINFCREDVRNTLSQLTASNIEIEIDELCKLYPKINKSVIIKEFDSVYCKCLEEPKLFCQGHDSLSSLVNAFPSVTMEAKAAKFFCLNYCVNDFKKTGLYRGLKKEFSSIKGWDLT